MNDFRRSPSHGANSSGMVILSSRATTTTTPNIISSPLSSGRAARGRKGESRDNLKKVDSAVYSYIQAVRALGKTKVSAIDIAEALGLTVDVAQKAAERLGSKGVKRA